MRKDDKTRRSPNSGGSGKPPAASVLIANDKMLFCLCTPWWISLGLISFLERRGEDMPLVRFAGLAGMAGRYGLYT
jgi:hypothetical protein